MRKLFILLAPLLLAMFITLRAENIQFIMPLVDTGDTIVFLRVEDGVRIDSATWTGAAAANGLDSTVGILAGVSTKFFVRVVFLGDLTVSGGYTEIYDRTKHSLSDAAYGVAADSVKEMARYNSNLFMTGFELNLIRNPSFEVDSVETPTAPFGWLTTTYATDSFLTNGNSKRSGKWGLDLDGDAAGDSAFIYSTPFMLEERALLKYGASWTGGGSDSFYIGLQVRTTAPVTWTTVDSIVARGSGSAGNFAGFSDWNTMTNQYQITAADSALPFRMMMRFENGTNVWTIDDAFVFAFPGQLAKLGDSLTLRANLSDVWRNRDTTDVDTSGLGEWLVNNFSTPASGSGNQSIVIGATDTVNNHKVAGVPVTVRDATGTQIGQTQFTNEDGYVTVGVDAAAVISVSTGSRIYNGHIFNAAVRTVIVGSTGDTIAAGHSTTPTDTVLTGDDFNVGVPSEDSTCRLNGYIVDLGQANARGAKVEIRLKSNVDITSGNNLLAGGMITTRTDSLGFWFKDIAWSSVVDSSLYEVRWKYRGNESDWKQVFVLDTTSQQLTF